MDTEKEIVQDDRVPSQFWVGPYGVLVPNSITKVKAIDGKNWIKKDGSETERFIPYPWPTKEQWLIQNANLCEDGCYYYHSFEVDDVMDTTSFDVKYNIHGL